ncbi:lipid-transfer protein [Striga asiatica]|uniref:Lipid-transfer protein n=1 Tax=Striga asiatica TaxID=4170 RepID=A0A5A7R0V8_STRAF|nr:lipid-transfer protein [Striga asiatica]
MDHSRRNLYSHLGELGVLQLALYHQDSDPSVLQNQSPSNLPSSQNPKVVEVLHGALHNQNFLLKITHFGAVRIAISARIADESTTVHVKSKSENNMRQCSPGLCSLHRGTTSFSITSSSSPVKETLNLSSRSSVRKADA